MEGEEAGLLGMRRNEGEAEAAAGRGHQMLEEATGEEAAGGSHQLQRPPRASRGPPGDLSPVATRPQQRQNHPPAQDDRRPPTRGPTTNEKCTFPAEEERE